MTEKVLITGATGFVGSHLAERLVKEGHDVTVLARKSSNLRWLKHLHLKYIWGDVSNIKEEDIAPVVSDADYIFHLAGVVHSYSPAYYNVINAKAAGRIASFAATHSKKLKRFVLASSLAAIGPGKGDNPADDTQTPRPICAYGKSKREGELEVLKYADAIPVSIVRPPPIFGPKDKDIFLFFVAAQYCFKPRFGFKPVRTALVHIDHIIEGILLAAKKDAAIGRAFLLGDGENASFDIIYSYIQQVAQRNFFIPITVPIPLLKLSGRGADAISKLTKKSLPLSYDKTIELSHNNWTVDDSLARELLGYRPLFTVKEGVFSTYNWYKKEGWL